MTTDISVATTSFQVENRSWLIRQPGGVGGGFTQSCQLMLSAFTQATHFPNGFIPSGVVLGQISASTTPTQSVVGPYDATATDGRQTAWGILFSGVRVVNPNTGVALANVGGAALTAFAVVRTSKLPIANGATGRGYLDVAAQTALARVHFIA